MRISDWSADVCSSDLAAGGGTGLQAAGVIVLAGIAGSQLFNALTAFVIAKSANAEQARGIMFWLLGNLSGVRWEDVWLGVPATLLAILACFWHIRALDAFRSEEHTSELQSLMRISYAVFCLKKKIQLTNRLNRQT